jgi:nucleoside-diphosphate-sugar epimerase
VVVLGDYQKKVLVTGASGFTGGHLCRTLIQRGYSVRALVREKSNYDAVQALGAEPSFGDLRDRPSLARAVEGINIVYHIAAAYREQDVPRHHFYDINVKGTENLLQVCEAAGIERFVHCSTVGVQGEIKTPPADENTPYNPGDFYQRSKVEGEKLALRFFKEDRLPGVVFRPVGIYGPGDLRFLKLFRYVSSGKFIMIGNGSALYHFTYVTDLVEGIILCGEKPEALGQIYTIGGDEYLSLNQFIRLLSEVLNVPTPKFRIPFWPVWVAGFFCEMICYPFRIHPPLYRRRLDFFVKDRAFDISKAKRELGYRPSVDLKTGLKITADWYRKQGWLT